MPNSNFFELLGLPVNFVVDMKLLSRNYRLLQAKFHPDKFAHASDAEQRSALQSSSLINQAYDTLRHPANRAAYLLEMAEDKLRTDHTMRPDPAFLMQQIEWRESLAEVDEHDNPEAALEHLLAEFKSALKPVEVEFSEAYASANYELAHHAVDKMQFIYKLLAEAEAVEARLLDE